MAKDKEIPFIYEVRGFWEETYVVTGQLERNSPQYLNRRENETNLMKKAVKIVTLGENMKKELINRGISKNKIKVIPNGVNTKIFTPVRPHLGIKNKIGVKSKYIVGYVGTIRKIEGLEYLIKAIDKVRQKKIDVDAVLIGSCENDYGLKLKQLSKKLGISNHIHFLDKIPFKKIKDFYSIIDIVILPRLNKRVCRLVTPLKQLEAMAMEKLVLASNLPALAEIIKPEISGDLFEPENHFSLAEKIENYLINDERRINLGKKAREFVKKKHNWSTLINNYKNIYNDLIIR